MRHKYKSPISQTQYIHTTQIKTVILLQNVLLSIVIFRIGTFQKFMTDIIQQNTEFYSFYIISRITKLHMHYISFCQAVSHHAFLNIIKIILINGIPKDQMYKQI